MIGFDDKTFLDNFPFKEIRPQQKTVLEKLQKSWENDSYKFYVCELPTGFGKSPVAQAIGMTVDDTFLLTVTKQLQDQYVKDFGSKKVVSLKGKANYPCNVKDGLNVECGPCTVDKNLLKECKSNGICAYYKQRDRALAAQIAVTSTQFFLYSTTCGRYWKPRDTIIVDECHLLEQTLVQWATTLISPKELKEEYDMFVPDYVPASGYVDNKEWLEEIWNIVVGRRAELQEEVKDMLDGKDPNLLSEDELEEIISSHGMYYKIDKIYKKLEVFFESPKKYSWLCEPQDDGLVVTPVEIKDIFQRYVRRMAKNKIVFMSATILDLPGFCKNLGIKKEEVGLIRVESEFPPEKSPIIYKPSGSMSFKNIESSIPKIIENVKEILLKNPNDKGIIHSGNYRLAQAIVDGVSDSRLLIKNEGENNESLMKRHIDSKKPTVLISPSLTTGADLKDDLSRWQIVVKLPFMSLADPRVVEKMKSDQDWYVSEMFRTFVQATGRSTRSEDDWSTTYVLDPLLYQYIFKYRKWFPPSFLKRIIWKESN
ncbi:ATP-dependent DNA helicase DinG [compost metagenome]